jgi:hypothetical protein
MMYDAEWVYRISNNVSDKVRSSRRKTGNGGEDFTLPVVIFRKIYKMRVANLYYWWS